MLSSPSSFPIKTLGFIGCGKMASALAQGAVQSGLLTSGNLLASSRPQGTSRERFLSLFPQDPPTWTPSNQEVVLQSDCIILATKPQQAEAVLPALKEISQGKLFISVLTGLPLTLLQKWLGPQAKIIRTMPNTPLLIRQGASVYTLGKGISPQEERTVYQLLEAGGKVWKVQENQINAITALSGSGPAYVFHFIHALIEGGQELGLDPSLSRELAIQTVLGATHLVKAGTHSPLELAEQVKSPGGTTLAACQVLEKGKFEPLIRQAMVAGKQRAEALACTI